MNNLDYAKSHHTDINLKLDNISALLSEMKNPEKELRFIHIGGTNGKGSVCSFLEEMLVFEGYKTGRFSSPELIRRNETIRINKEDISDDALNRILKKVHNSAQKLKTFPSPFEILLAAAFLYFKENACDYVILEVGMGGEGDATNIIDPPEIAIITKIAKDHAQYLGTTLEEIAKVKSGIIKKGSKVITTDSNKSLFSILDKNKNLISVSPFRERDFSDIYEKVLYKDKEIILSLGGVNQRENAALSVKAAELLQISDNSVIYGLSNAKNPARFEKLSDNLYFDGAHNPDGAKALSESISRYFPDEKPNLVMGVMKDKEFSKMLEILKGKVSDFFFVDVKNNERAMKKEDMKKIADSFELNSDICNNISEALRISKGKTVICGSLYMYKDLIK